MKPSPHRLSYKHIYKNMFSFRFHLNVMRCHPTTSEPTPRRVSRSARQGPPYSIYTAMQTRRRRRHKEKQNQQPNHHITQANILKMGTWRVQRLAYMCFEHDAIAQFMFYFVFHSTQISEEAYIQWAKKKQSKFSMNLKKKQTQIYFTKTQPEFKIYTFITKRINCCGLT